MPSGHSKSRIEPRDDCHDEVGGITKRFGDILAVDHLTASAGSGKVTAFLGPNGAGKTTTVRILLGLVAPSSGLAPSASRSTRT